MGNILTVMRPILAKSPSKKGYTVSLLEHTQHVVLAAEAIATKLNFDVRLARFAAIIHDLGKAHNNFQAMVYEDDVYALNFYAHRHELSSLAFLPLFDADCWDDIIEMVVAHHKPIRNDKNSRGILDLDEADDEWLYNHLEDWLNWQAYGLAVIESFDIPVRTITLQEATDALMYCVKYCKKRYKMCGWSSLRGLLMAADHMASALSNNTKYGIKGLFEVPKLSYFEDPSRLANKSFPLGQIDANDSRQHTMVVAPTGAGKTDFLLRRCKGRVFYTLPFQASINSMFKRILDAKPGGHVRVLHATSRMTEKKEGRSISERVMQDKVGASVKVLTPHQLAAIVFGTPGYESIILDIQGCDVILDEIHTYANVGQAMVLSIIDVLVSLNCRIHVGTATMPTSLYNEVLARLGGKEQVNEVSLPATILDEFDRHIIHKIPNTDTKVVFPLSCNGILDEAFKLGQKILIVCNTVNGAQAEYLRLKQVFPNVKSMLLHSRFRRCDRSRMEEELISVYEKGNSACFVVSTQIVEVSLDISFDMMITQCAPIDALVQRFGRVNRRRVAGVTPTLKHIYIIQPTTNTLPYDVVTLEESYESLPDDQVLHERDIQGIINTVYPTLAVSAIGAHVIWVNGEVTQLSMLTNRPHSVLLEALNIQSANCILECDVAEYMDEETGWERQLELIIPVSWITFSMNSNTKNYKRLDVGISPYIVPQELEEHLKIGLVLRKSK